MRRAGLVRRTLMALVLAVSALPATAHHSFAMFDLSRIETVQGTLRAVVWTEPHVWIDLAITDASGQARVIAYQCLDPIVLRRRGWSRGSLRAGERVRISYFPNRFGQTGGAVRTVTRHDGTVLSSYDFKVQPSARLGAH